MPRGPALAAGLALAATALGGCSAFDDAATRPSRPATEWGVRTSLPASGTLPARTQWTATVRGIAPGQVSTVGFYIDGKLAWVQAAAPFVFGGPGHTLDARMLGARRPHTFAVRVSAADGTTASDQATLRAPAGPEQPEHLAGTMRRRIAADRGVTAGVWQAVLDDHGLHLRGPDGRRYGMAARGRGGSAYRGPLEVGDAYIDPVSKETNALCPPESTGTYRWRAKRGRTRLRAAQDTCAPRRTILEGTFTRAAGAGS